MGVNGAARRAAVVSADDGIYIMDAGDAGDGNGGGSGRAAALRVAPPGERCVWPVWSPDGGRLAYSVYPDPGSNGSGAFRIMTRGLADGAGGGGDGPRLDGAAAALHVNEPGTDGIARHTPHYLMWSPDGARAAFISQRRDAGLSLGIRDASGRGRTRWLLSGAPLHFCWTRDSRRILAHSGQLHYLADLGDADAPPAQAPVASSGYMAPCASPTDDMVAICGEISDTRQGLLIADAVNGGAVLAAEYEGGVGFSWSPDGSRLVVASGLDRGSGYYGRLDLIDTTGAGRGVFPPPQLAIEEPLLCFFWSPDGRSLAYVGPSEGADGSVRLCALEVESGERRCFADFRPSREQLTMYMFFDQYAQSHRVWSADSGSLIFAGAPGLRRTRTALPEPGECGVYAIDAAGDGGGDARFVCEGTLGVWSP